jgi:hypothetical protein
LAANSRFARLSLIGGAVSAIAAVAAATVFGDEISRIMEMEGVAWGALGLLIAYWVTFTIRKLRRIATTSAPQSYIVAWLVLRFIALAAIAYLLAGLLFAWVADLAFEAVLMRALLLTLMASVLMNLASSILLNLVLVFSVFRRAPAG